MIFKQVNKNKIDTVYKHYGIYCGKKIMIVKQHTSIINKLKEDIGEFLKSFIVIGISIVNMIWSFIKIFGHLIPIVCIVEDEGVKVDGIKEDK